ncbi:protein of unknown function [Ruminococcaceae bacterium YRB3002]|nr:protein of unknown function [Ruminococcaceae bacterium YRB3002]
MKSFKKLLVPLIIMVVLVIGVIVYFAVSNANKTPDDEEFDSNILTLSSTQISSISVHRKNADDIVMGINYDAGNGTTSYTYNDNPVTDAGYSIEAVERFITMLSSYAVNGKVNGSAALSEYGLDDPEAVVTIAANDGKTYRISLGDDTYEGANCYLMMEGDPNIYIITSAKKTYTSYTDIDFLKSQLLNIDYSKINTIKFDRLTDNTHLTVLCDIYAETGEPVYTITEPFSIKASPYFENLMEYICTLEITKFIDIPAEEMSKYGMDDPAFHFLITMDNGERTELYLSEKLGGFYYGRLAGVSEYFMISDIQIKGLETPLLTLIESYINYCYAYDISSISGQYGNESFRYDLNVKPNSSISADTSTVKLDNRNAIIYMGDGSGRTYAALMFETLATIMIGGVDLNADPSINGSIMTLTFITKDYNTAKFDFVPRDNDTYYVFRNDEYTKFYISSTELFYEGESGSDTFGVWPAYKLLDTAIRNNTGGVYTMPGTESAG